MAFLQPHAFAPLAAIVVALAAAAGGASVSHAASPEAEAGAPGDAMIVVASGSGPSLSFLPASARPEEVVARTLVLEARPVALASGGPVVVVALEGAAGTVTAIDPATTEAIWRAETGFAIADLAADGGGGVYAAGHRGQTVRFDIMTGERQPAPAFGRRVKRLLAFAGGAGLIGHVGGGSAATMPASKEGQAKIEGSRPRAIEPRIFEFGAGVVGMAVAPARGLLFVQLNGLNGFVATQIGEPETKRRVGHETSIGLPSLIRELGFLDFDGFNQCSGIAVRPSESEVWTSCGHHLNVHAVGDGDFPARGHMRMPDKGAWITFSANGGRAYVSLPDSDALLEVDADSLQFIRTIEVVDRPGRSVATQPAAFGKSAQ